MLRFVSLLAVLSLASACAAAPDDPDDGNATHSWERSFAEAQAGKADGTSCNGVWVPDQHGFQKRVALTFDDGPNPETTPAVLDLLAAHQIQATFFINGNKVSSDAARAVLARERGEGHLIGNHSQTHADFQDMTSSAQMTAAVADTQVVLQSAGITPGYFRFPFGSATCSAMGIVQGFGLKVTGWNVDSADWCFAAGQGRCPRSTFKYVPNSYRDDMVGYTLSQIRARNGGIVLFHDIHPNTVAHLEPIISTLEAEGFSFVRIDDTATFPLLNGIVPPFVGDPCTTDAECEFEGGSCHRFTANSGASAGFCSASCAGTCPDQSGKAPTFCASLDGGLSGSCVSKSNTQNASCAAIPGTVAAQVNRFVGSSGAPAATATVCMPSP